MLCLLLDILKLAIKRPKFWKNTLHLKIGVFFLKKGSLYKIGDTFLARKDNGDFEQKTVTNISYDFGSGNINLSYNQTTQD